MVKSITKNRKAYHEYSIEEKFESGISLTGSEVKSIRMGHGSISEGYAMIRDGQAWLINAYIPTLKHASHQNHKETRERRLLMHRKEIDKLDTATCQKGYTLVPLELYFNDQNIVKLELGLARGKASHDKRASEKNKDAKREIERVMKNR
ncbi:MAG: SsrA-binding protein SmpB [Silvanigrellaceae bacterium]|nr:SsrA-binding protein SmpB [Silvanigrellaceae bacterium]